MKAKLKFTWELPLVLLQIAWLAYTRIFQNPVLVDDAYIHFRCALNMVRGQGMVFNPGETVLATTSPVYVCLLALFNRLTGVDFPRLASGFNFACEVGVTLCLVSLLRRVKVPLLARQAIVLIVNLEFWRIVFAHSGMEESLFILASLLILLALEGGVWVAAGLLLGILGWVRPEGALVWLAGALGLAVMRRWRDLARIYGLAIALSLVIAGLLVAKYGTFIPQSVNAKGNAPWFGPGYSGGGWGPVQFLITPGDLTFFYLLNGFHVRWGDTSDKIHSLLQALAQFSLMGFGVGWLLRQGRRLIALFLGVFFVSYYLFHAILATSLFYWYFVPYYFVSQLLALLGWWALIEAGQRRLVRRWPDRPALGRCLHRLALPALVVLYWVAGAANGQALKQLEPNSVWNGLTYRLRPTKASDRENHYIEVAKAFNKLLPAGDPAQVGCIEIGIFGYYFHGRILDAFGLVSPEALDVLKPGVSDALPASCRAFPWNIFMHFRPPYIMSSIVFLEDAPAEFLQAYEKINPVQSDQLIVYKLRDAAKH